MWGRSQVGGGGVCGGRVFTPPTQNSTSLRCISFLPNLSAVSLSCQISPLPCKLPQHQHPSLPPPPKLPIPTPHTLAHAKARSILQRQGNLGVQNQDLPQSPGAFLLEDFKYLIMFILLFPCNLYQLIWAACRGPSSRSPCQAHVFGL